MAFYRDNTEETKKFKQAGKPQQRTPVTVAFWVYTNFYKAHLKGKVCI